MASSINMTPQQKIEAVVDGLKRFYPTAGFSFGYIGNLSLQYGDDRSWYIFTQLQEENGSSVSFGGWSTDNMELFLKSIDTSIVNWVNKTIKRILAAEKADKDAYAAGKSVKYRRFRK